MNFRTFLWVLRGPYVVNQNVFILIDVFFYLLITDDPLNRK